MGLNSKKRSFLIFLGLILAVAGFSQAQEDQKGEYVRWSQGLQYTVQQGDTLWDLSQRFFDTPAMWPELWKNNPHIKNPHWIEPGTVINLFIDQGMAFIPTPEPPPPPPEPAPEPVVEPPPPPPPPSYFYPPIAKTGFVRMDPVKSLGEVSRILDNKVMASSGDKLYATLADAQTVVEGDRFTLWRPDGILKNAFRKGLRKAEVGVKHLILGDIVVVEVRDGILAAKVERSFLPIKAGDQLMPYQDLPVNIVLKPSVKDLEGMILASEIGKTYVGDGDIVFIDKGAQDGVTPGQFYSIYTDENPQEQKVGGQGAFDKIWKKNNGKVSFEEVVGKLLVLRAEDNNSTALITESKSSIFMGTPFKTPTLLER